MICRFCEDDIFNGSSTSVPCWITDGTARGAEVCPDNHKAPFTHEPDEDDDEAQAQYDQQQADAVESNQDWLQDFYDRHS